MKTTLAMNNAAHFAAVKESKCNEIICVLFELGFEFDSPTLVAIDWIALSTLMELSNSGVELWDFFTSWIW